MSKVEYQSPCVELLPLSAGIQALAASFGSEGMAGYELIEDAEHSYYF